MARQGPSWPGILFERLEKLSAASSQLLTTMCGKIPREVVFPEKKVRNEEEIMDVGCRLVIVCCLEVFLSHDAFTRPHRIMDPYSHMGFSIRVFFTNRSRYKKETQ